MGLTPIPFSAIVEYARINDIEDLDDFLYFIRLMDNKLLDLEDKSGKQHNKRNHSQSGHKGRTRP